MTLRSLAIICCVGAAIHLTAAEDAASFGEFTLANGEKLVGYYHADTGTFEVYELARKVQVAPDQILAQRRLAPGTEAEPTSRKELDARVAHLQRTIMDVEVEMKVLQNKASDLEKAKQMRRLEVSKREEGCKDADEHMQAEQDPARKAVYAALIQEELKAIAAGNAAIAEYESASATTTARVEARAREHLDLMARHDWLLSRQSALPTDK